MHPHVVESVDPDDDHLDGRERRRRILVVEDDPDLRAALVDDLADSGAEVIEAVDGLDGLARMREVQPDVVVLDMLMPRMDGWQFRLVQRRDPNLSRTPVVAMSASGTPAAAAVDADAYLVKPFGSAALGRAIDDVLAARQHKEELEHSAHQERLAALGTLAAGLAHEINNPLTYVIMNLTAAERSLPQVGADPDRAEHVNRLVAAALQGTERIAQVVRSVRILARRDHGAHSPIDLRAPIDSALTIVAHDLRARARLVTDFGDAPYVMGDEGQLGQVILNLLTNAVQAVPEDQPDKHEIKVSTSTDADGNAIIEVRDTGSGIPDHLLPHVFEPFYTTRPPGQGTGLGLSVSHRIVSEHGGTLTVHSVVDRGTVFRVMLPPGSRRLHTH